MEMIKALTKNRSRIRIAVGFLVIAVAAAVVLVQTRFAYGYDQDIAKLNRFVQNNKSNTASMKVFQEGRDLIEAQNWQRAAERFNDFIKSYPKDKDVDAALYWYGYALQKQGLKEEAKAPLLKLISNYPNSTWRREADGLLVLLGAQDSVKTMLADDNCELKVLALQSLFDADPDRAISYVSETLKTSSPCPGFQAAAVSLLGSYGKANAIPILVNIATKNGDLKLRLTAIKRLGEQENEQITEELIKLYETDKTKEIRAQILRALLENRSARSTAKLFEIARNGDDPALRLVAIRYLGQLEDAASLEELIRMYDAERTPDVRGQILRAISEREEPRAHAKIVEIARRGESPEIRMEAIRRLGEGEGSMDELIQLYSSETDVQIKISLLRAFGNNEDPRSYAKLLEVARGNDAVELRMFAIRELGNRDDDAAIAQLIPIYDSSQDLQIKQALMRAFSNSKQKVAVRKLIDIARNGSTPVELRKLAVRYLGESRDPEALKFLEDLLK